MPEVTDRIQSLSENRRRLLGRLLNRERESGGAYDRDRGTSGVIPPGVVSPTPLPGRDTLDQSASVVEVKASYKRFYDAVNSQLDSSVFGPFSFFLNYGYLHNLSPQCSRVQLPDHFVNKNSVRLVLELIGDYDLRDRRVLDVGCGRGGTVFVIKTFFEPRSVQGLDLSSKAIVSCRENHRYDNVRFDEGDAERLPFDSELFDVVTNVESSHSYPNLGAFYKEVFRVLAPGGAFLYTDVFPAGALTDYLAMLKNTGFSLEVERDITANVLLSCDDVARTRVGAYDASNDPELMNNFLAAPGSQVYEDMRNGRWSYRIYRFRKPAPAGTAGDSPEQTGVA